LPKLRHMRLCELLAFQHETQVWVGDQAPKSVYALVRSLQL